VHLTISCASGAGSPVTLDATWTGTRYEGQMIDFVGNPVQVSITGWSRKAPMPSPRFGLGAATLSVGGQDVVYAGFWRRWAALFLDQLILSIPLGMIFFFLALAMGLTGAMGSSTQPPVAAILGMEFGFYLIWWTAALFYFATQESSEAQATFGKRALGIKVTDLEGRRISFKHAMGRWFAAALSYMSIYIGFLMAGFTQRKQGLHDVIASTLVVDKWAYTAFPERQERKPSGCVIVFMVVIVGSLILVPIVVAIAVAQYAEYARRAGQVWVEPEPQGTMLCVTPPSSAYVARCLPPSFEV
jgi:uncharacterized RDD family membrane protein YckC